MRSKFLDLYRFLSAGTTALSHIDRLFHYSLKMTQTDDAR